MATFLKNDLTTAMRQALSNAWQFKKRMPMRPFTAASCCAIEPTMRALLKRGFIEAASGIAYEFTERGRSYAALQWGNAALR
jgi:hypothetical protein